MHDSQLRLQYYLLFLAIIMFIPAVYGTFGYVGSRTKDPGQYWSALAIYYLAGIGFIGFYLYKVGAF